MAGTRGCESDRDWMAERGEQSGGELCVVSVVLHGGVSQCGLLGRVG